MALVAASLAFVNLASQWSLAAIEGVVSTEASRRGRAELLPDDRGPQGADVADADREVALIAVVAEQQWQWSTSAVVVAGGLAGGIGWFVSRRMLSPIDRITATANRISATTLDERIALDGPDDELRRLSRTIDALLDRLEAAFEAQRRFVSHAAHELRTPLAVQRATLQIGLPDDATPPDVVAARTEMLEQNRRTEHLVESLLVLAEAERGLEGSSVLVDLGSCVAAAVGGVRAAAAVTGVSLSVEGTAPDGVVGEPVLVQQLLGNLLDNAVEYNVPGGVVRVELHAGGFVVENSGPDVPATEIAALSQPFRRGAQTGSHRHSGLGLSIITAIVTAHGWSLVLAPGERGGLRVAVGVSSV
ncbi:hypothetical protein GCM10009706_22040 [Curtobacterium citreum]|nr:signal transduction histidine kinase [Curtobacterium citreum]GGL82979.1 hypothetical protein GCM10009706_22040 [Curtobacterium citreum]